MKIGAKIVLARLPVPYGLWSRLNLFKHGPMEDLSYARDVFAKHHEIWTSSGGSGKFTCLELGPGDSLLSALIGRSIGVSQTWIVDTGRWARADVSIYREAAAILFPPGTPDAPSYAKWGTIDHMLDDCRATYLTQGLESLRSLGTASVDLLWSQAVLEHVTRSDFADTMVEVKRLLTPRGVSSHVVDFKDHLGGRLNSLRFSEATWEGKLFSSSGFYTNRLRAPEVMRLAGDAGLAAELAWSRRWESLPTPREQMDPSFQAMPDEDLLISDCHLVLRHPASS